MNRCPIKYAATALAVVLGAVSAHAQWSMDASLNLPLADAAGDQVQAKIAVRPGGGYYVSWFDNRSGGYDVYLQRLDADGVEQFAHNGVLVADRSFSSTQDYGLGVDTVGNALLVFRDDRFGGERITAAKVTSDGALAWGSDGVALSSGPEFVAAPKIVGTTDGDALAAWSSDNVVRVQRLAPDGTPIYVPDVVISDQGGAAFSVSDVQPADAGAAIVSLVFQPGGFLGPKHLYAQKFAADGTPQWGASPLAVFDGGSLQFGNFPAFTGDGSGGGVFSWYSTSAGLQCFAQRVRADGTETFAHNGVAVSLAPRDRVSPTAVYDAASESTFVFWREELPGPTYNYGIYGQRLDALGARQWSDDGIAIAPLDTLEVGAPRAAWQGDGATVLWTRGSGFQNDVIVAQRVDVNGLPTWSPAQRDIATTPSGKSRLWVAQGDDPFALLSWSDTRNGSDDVYAQNINLDGTLGIAVLDSDGDGVADDADNCVLVANADQRDTDGDQIGNLCDADLNNDCNVNPLDLGLLRNAFFGVGPDADFNGDGVVNPVDLGIMRQLFFLPPGPSGLPGACSSRSDS